MSEADVSAVESASLETLLGDVPLDDPESPVEETARRLARRVQETWDVVIPERALAGARDRSEVARACLAGLRAAVRARMRRRRFPAAGRAVVRIEPPQPQGRGAVVRSGVLSAYDAEELFDAARRLGAGTRVEVVALSPDGREIGDAMAERARGLPSGTLEVRVRTESAG